MMARGQTDPATHSLVFAGEEWSSAQHLGKNATDRPHVDGLESASSGT